MSCKEAQKSPRRRAAEQEQSRTGTGTKIRNLFVPVATTFTGVGGLLFHANHGPGHLICIAGAGLLVVIGGAWSWLTRNRKPRPKSCCHE
jgi:hypothetical protein